MYKLTRIVKENMEFFEDLLPEGGLQPGEEALGVLSEEDDTVAACVFRKEGDTVTVEWLYVDPEYRRRGVGGNLLKTLADFAKEKAEILRLSYYNDSEGVEEMLKGQDFFFLSGNTVCTLLVDDLLDCPEVKKMERMQVRKQPTPLNTLLREEKMKLLSCLSECYQAKLLLADCDPTHSFCIKEEDGQFSGCLLTKKLEEKHYQVSLLYNSGNVMQAVFLLKSIMEEGITLTFVVANSHVKSLLENLTKGGEGKIQKTQLKIAFRELAA